RELEEDPDPGEIDAEVLGEVANPHDPPDVVLRVEADVRRRSGRADQAGVLVDPERPGMDAHDACRHADDVDGASRIAGVGAAEGHAHGASTLRGQDFDVPAVTSAAGLAFASVTGEIRI